MKNIVPSLNHKFVLKAIIINQTSKMKSLPKTSEGDSKCTRHIHSLKNLTLMYKGITHCQSIKTNHGEERSSSNLKKISNEIISMQK